MKNFEDGIKQERERVAALEEMRLLPAYQPASLQQLLSDCIRQGKSVSEATSLILRELTKSTVLAEIEGPGDIVTGQVDTATGLADSSQADSSRERAPITEV